MGFGQRINELRKENGLTQKQFADELNLSTTTVASWEKEVKKPSFEVLILISEKFNVSLDWLCETKKQNEFEVKTWSDIIRMLYAVISCKPIPGEISFVKDKNDFQRVSLSFARYLSYPEFYDFLGAPQDIYVEVAGKAENGSEQYEYEFESPIYKFFNNYSRMKKLVDENAIDNEIFDMWLSKSLEKYDFNIWQKSESVYIPDGEEVKTNADNNEEE